VFAEHDPAAAAGCSEGRQRRLGPDLDLTRAGGAAELLDAVGVHRGAAAPGSQIAAARRERVRSLDPDITSVEGEGISAFYAVPLEALQKELRHRCMTVVRIEYINVVGRKHSADQFDAFKKQTDDGRGTKASRLSPNAGVAGSASSPTSSSHLAALDAAERG